jgi:hypothetical protein
MIIAASILENQHSSKSLLPAEACIGFRVASMSEEQKKTRVRTTTDMVALAVFVSFVGSLLAWIMVYHMNIGGIRRRIYTRGHKITKTLAGFRALALQICSATDVSQEQPPAEIDSLMAFLYEHMPYLKDLQDVRIWEDRRTGLVLDQWDNPIRLVVKSPHHYTFISPGPNGKYQEGRGDDIVYDFDPWELAEDDDPNETCTQ